MVVSEQTYQCVALEDTEGQWELHDGRLREKPTMGAEHNDVMATLALALGAQLDRRVYRIRINSTHVRQSSRSYYVPDIVVVPAASFREQTGRLGELEVYEIPLPLVVEIWSPSTGGYDVDEKLPAYQQRGDAEVWRLRPFERTLIAWCRQLDGSYAETMDRGGTVQSTSLPGVTIDLDAVFDFDELLAA